MSDLAEDSLDSCLSCFAECNQIASSLAADLENAKNLDYSQLEYLKIHLNKFKSISDFLIDERSESLRYITLLENQLKAFPDSQATETFEGQELAAELKQQVSQKIDELEKERKERVEAQQEAESALCQLHLAQEQLEYYLLLKQKQYEMLEVSMKLQARTVAILVSAQK